MTFARIVRGCLSSPDRASSGEPSLWLVIAVIALAVLVLASAAGPACADRDGDGAAPPVDCNDANGEVKPGGREVCDGYDNLCSGSIDPGCLRACPAPRASVEIPVGAEPGASNRPRIARTARGFDVVWVDDRDGNAEIYLARLGPDGAPLYPDLRVTDNPAASTAPAIASPGDVRGIAWIDARDPVPQLYFRRLGDFGIDTGAVRVTVAAGGIVEPSIAWGGSFWAIAYAERLGTAYQVRIERVSDTGQPSQHPKTVSSSSPGGGARNPAVAFDANGNAFAVAWEDARHGATEIYFRRLDADLNPVGGEVRVTNAVGASAGPAIVWAGTRFVIGWRDERDGNAEAYAAVLDAGGARIGPELRLSATTEPSEAPRLAFTGAEVVAAWVDGSRLLTARIGLDGTLIEPASEIAAPTPGMLEADVAWGGEIPAVVRENPSDSSIRVAFPACCGDLDGDGFDLCGGDCDDGRPNVHPGAAEGVNALDDDCDGEVDEPAVRACGGPDRTAPPRSHSTPAAAGSSDADLAWNGASAGLVWNEVYPGFSRGIFFRHLARDGVPLGPAIELGPAVPAWRGEPAIAAKPDGWGVFGASDVPGGGSGWRFEVLDLAGNAFGDPTYFAGFGIVEDPEVVWDGRGFAAAYQINDFVYFARFTAAGVPRGPELFFGSVARHPALAWNGREYALVMEFFGDAGQGIYLVRIDAEGRKIDGPRRVDAGHGVYAVHDPDLVWTGFGYALAYIPNHQDVGFVSLDADGNLVSGVSWIYVSGYHWVFEVVLAWNGEEFYAQWYDDDLRTVLARRLDGAGAPIGDAFVVHDAGDRGIGNHRTALVGVGSAFLSASSRYSVTPPDVVTRSLGCCPYGDPDGDLYCAEGVDCDPYDFFVHPGATEICDGKDTDCDGTIVGEGPPPLVASLRFLTKTELAWDAPGGGWDSYDTQRGDLRALLGTRGDFAAATTLCLAPNAPAPGASDATVPGPGQGFAYYTAAGSALCAGTFDEDRTAQAGSRDAEIAQSGHACP